MDTRLLLDALLEPTELGVEILAPFSMSISAMSERFLYTDVNKGVCPFCTCTRIHRIQLQCLFMRHYV